MIRTPIHTRSVKLARLIFVLFPFAASSAEQCVKTVAWHNDGPWANKTSADGVQGANIDLVHEALVRMGCEASFVELPLARALHDLEEGSLDMMVSFDALAANPDFSARLVPVVNPESAWKMIDADRLDGQISEEIAADTELKKLDLSDRIHKSSILINSLDDYALFGKKKIDADFVGRFNKAYETMLQDGSFESIWRRYLPCNGSAKTFGCS